MSAKKIESGIADHPATIVDYEVDGDETALDDANELIKAIEKSGFQIVRRASGAARTRMKNRRGGRTG